MKYAWKEIIKSDYFLESIIGTTISADEIELDAPKEETIEYYFSGLSSCAGCHANAINDVPAYTQKSTTMSKIVRIKDRF